MTACDLPECRTVCDTMKYAPKADKKLRAALASRLQSESLRDISAALGEIDGKPAISHTTLADYANGHPAGRPHIVSSLSLDQAERLAKFLGLRLEISKP